MTNDYKQRVKLLIQDNDLQEALKLMAENGLNVVSLQTRFNRLQSQIINNTETNEYIDTTLNKLVGDLLAKLDQTELDADVPIPQATTEESTKDRLVKQLLNKKWIAILVVAFVIVSSLIPFLTDVFKFKDQLTQQQKAATLIHGQVLDSMGNPIKGITVQVLEYPAKSISDGRGNIFLSLKLNQKENITLEFLGNDNFEQVTRLISISPQEDTVEIPKAFLIPHVADNGPAKPAPKTFRIASPSGRMLIKEIESATGMLHSPNGKTAIAFTYPSENIVHSSFKNGYSFNKEGAQLILKIDQSACSNLPPVYLEENSIVFATKEEAKSFANDLVDRTILTNRSIILASLKKCL